MKNSLGNNFILELRLAGGNAFDPDYAWRDQVTGSLFCPHCKNVYEHVKSIDARVQNKPRRTDIDLINGCYRVAVLSERLISLVGPRRIIKVAGLGKIVGTTGVDHGKHRTAVGLSNQLLIRGGLPYKTSLGPSVGLCKECRRILYWPKGDRYVLRGKVPQQQFFLSNGHIFCKPKFYDEIIEPAKLIRVDVLKVPILDEPVDGLPVDTEELREHLRTKKMFK